MSTGPILDLEALADALWPLLEDRIVASFPGQKGTGSPLPNPPLNLAVTGTTTTSVSLSWTAPAGGSTSYNLYRNGTKVQTAIAGTITTDTGLSPGTPYTYYVTSQATVGEGSRSNALVGTTGSVPNAPQSLAVTSTTSSTVSLSWAAPVGGATTYNLYRNGTEVQTGISGLTTTDTGLTASTSYTYTVSGSNSFGEGAKSSPVTGTTKSSSTLVKGIVNANGFWPANQFWGTQATPGVAQQVYKNNILPLMRNNTNLNVVLMSMSLADITAADPNDISIGIANIQAVANDMRTITSHKCMVMVKLWLTYFAQEPSLPSRTSLACWSSYAVAQGYPTSFYEAGFGRSQLQWDLPGVFPYIQNIMVKLMQAFNNDDRVLSIGFQDETDVISVIDKVPPAPSQPAPWTSGATVLNSTSYLSNWINMMLAQSDAAPNMLTHVPWNFLPPGGTQAQNAMVSDILSMLSTRPGKWLFGGPDPWTHSTTYHSLMTQGAAGPLGADLRSSFFQMGETQQGKETGTGNPSAATIYTTNVGTGKCQINIWPYIPDGASGQVETVSTFLAAIAANNGQTAPLPTVGNYVL